MFGIKFVKIQDILPPFHIFVTSIWHVFDNHIKAFTCVVSANILISEFFLLLCIVFGIGPKIPLPATLVQTHER